MTETKFREGVVYGLLTDEEKQMLNEADAVDQWCGGNWETVEYPMWGDSTAYRPAPKPKEPEPEKELRFELEWSRGHPRYMIDRLYMSPTCNHWYGFNDDDGNRYTLSHFECVGVVNYNDCVPSWKNRRASHIVYRLIEGGE